MSTGVSTLSIFMHMSFNLAVIRAAESVYLGSDEGQLKTHRDLHLVLRADSYANICLISGERINKFDIDFTISTRWKNGKELDQDLDPDDIGFFCHTEDKDGKPAIHGGAIWLFNSFPEALADPKAVSNVSVLLANVQTIPEYALPFQWGLNRPNILLIKSIEISVARNQAETPLP